jgi:hypothetical protein
MRNHKLIQIWNSRPTRWPALRGLTDAISHILRPVRVRTVGDCVDMDEQNFIQMTSDIWHLLVCCFRFTMSDMTPWSRVHFYIYICFNIYIPYFPLNCTTNHSLCYQLTNSMEHSPS